MTTPRTLAECRFTTGYRSAKLRSRVLPVAGIVYVLALFAFIGWLLAQGV